MHDLQYVSLFAVHVHEGSFVIQELDRFAHAPQPIVRIIRGLRETNKGERGQCAQHRCQMGGAARLRPVSHT